jgi:hypothetical protein
MQKNFASGSVKKKGKNIAFLLRPSGSMLLGETYKLNYIHGEILPLMGPNAILLIKRNMEKKRISGLRALP